MVKEINYVNVGDIAPNFCLPSVQGKNIRLSDFSANKIALFFWASW